MCKYWFFNAELSLLFETSVLSRSIGHSPPYSFRYRDLVCVTVSIDLQSFPSDPPVVLRGNWIVRLLAPLKRRNKAQQLECSPRIVVTGLRKIQICYLKLLLTFEVGIELAEKFFFSLWIFFNAAFWKHTEWVCIGPDCQVRFLRGGLEWCVQHHICNKCLYNTVEPRFTNSIHSWRPFVTRHVRKPKLLWSHGVLFNNILKKPQNTMKFKRRHGEFEQGCVLSEITQQLTFSRLYSQLVDNRCCRLACSLLEIPFVTRDVFCWENLFVNRFVRDERRSWTEVSLYSL
jgi:hypothetical protein